MKELDITKCIPVGNSVLVKSLVSTEKEGEIFIPESARQETQYEVLAFGTKFNSEQCPVQIGNKVLIAGKGGDMLNIGGAIYWSHPAENIIAILED